MLFKFSEMGLFFTIMAIISLYLLKRSLKTNNIKHEIFSYAMIFLTIIFIGEAIEQFLTNPSYRLFFYGFDSIGYAFMPTVGVMMVLAFTGYEKYLKKRNKVFQILIIIAIIFSILTFTNQWTHLMGYIIPSGHTYIYQTNWVFKIYETYQTLEILISVIIIIMYTLRNKRNTERSIIFVFFATISPLITTIIQEMTKVYGINKLGCALTLIFLTAAVLKYNLLDNKNIIYEEFVLSSNIGMLIADTDGTIVEINPKFREIIPTSNDIIGKTIEDYFKDHNYILNFYKSNETELEFNIPNLKTGQYKYYKLKKVPLYQDNILIGTLNKVEDITIIKKESFEKEVLIKEIHHRIKNNLQIIISLINLDVRLNPDKPEKTLKQVETRIETIALLHEQMYDSNSLKVINLREYIKSLVELINKLSNNEIKFHYDIENINLDILLGTPIGLILIEIINNSLKYAFPNGSGNVYIKAYYSKKGDDCDDEVNLIIYDDGVGLNEEIDITSNTNSLGLKIINILVKQIDGTIRNYECKGVGYKITFNK